MKFKNIFLGIIAFALVATVSCTKEYINPNSATKAEVLKSADGILGMCVGLRQSFSTTSGSPLYGSIVCGGLSSKELTVLNTGNGALASIESGGGNLGGSNVVTANIWISSNLIKANAQLVFDNAGVIADKATQDNAKAYALLFKAMSIGTMAQYWEKVPVEVISVSDYQKGTRANFVDRIEALNAAIGMLNQANGLIKASPTSATFNAKVGTSISLANTIPAMIARYSIMAGKNDDAIAAADAVSQTVKSTFAYDGAAASVQNPVFASAFLGNNTVGGLAGFGLATALRPDSTDARIAFYLGTTELRKVTGFHAATTTAIPIHLPGEMTLIKAEALARKGDLPNAIIELNKVLTRTTDPSGYGVTAKQKAYSGTVTAAAVLEEIYRNRSIELYLSGLRLEDSRRFGRPAPNAINAERSRNFYPYPTNERDNNTNTPPDPAL
jgi:starch-binding outer membrane protein, SusD/RagB family